MLDRIDHVGIAVPDLNDALTRWSRWGLDEPLVETVAEQQVRVAMLSVGDGKVELLEPLRRDSPVGRFLAGRGPGLHHVAFRVADLEQALALAADRGMELIDRVPRPGAGGARVGFVHPRATGGTLVELCER